MIIKTREQAARAITAVISVTLLIGGLVLVFMPHHAHRILAIVGGLSLAVMGLFALVRPKQARRIGAIVGGVVLLVAGGIMLVTPGPGLAAIVGGLALLATEFVWARRLLQRFKDGAIQVKDAVIGKKKE